MKKIYPVVYIESYDVFISDNMIINKDNLEYRCSWISVYIVVDGNVQQDVDSDSYLFRPANLL